MTGQKNNISAGFHATIPKLLGFDRNITGHKDK